MKVKIYIKITFIFFLALYWSQGFTENKEQRNYPLLFGMNIGAKNYDDLQYQKDISRLNAVVLGFYRGWKGKHGQSIREAVRNIKRYNPDILIGQYTVLNEAYSDPNNVATQDKLSKLNHENWWLRNSKGEKLQWSKLYSTWDINITDLAQADKNGLRYPGWLALRDYNIYFSKVPEFDIWYFDNIFYKSRVNKADWKGTWTDISSAANDIQRAFRRAHLTEWRAARKLNENLIQIGNIDNNLSYEEYKGKLQGAFLECLMGKKWSIGNKHGWSAVMKRYRDAINNTIAPNIVIFHICGSSSDYKLFRFSYASSLLDNGWYSYTDEEKGYSSVPWFDEYNVKLGKPLEPPTYTADNDGTYKRRFENGMVIVNTNLLLNITTKIEPGYRRISGEQDPQVNNGLPVNVITIRPQDGLVLIKDIPKTPTN